MEAWTILCDFDGTISVDDAIDRLLERFGQPGWERIESDWRAGRIGSRECMTGQVALLDLSAAELDAYLGTLAIDPAFPAFVSAARRREVPIQVVSDGLDVVIANLLDRHGVADLPVVANHLRAHGQRRWSLTSPWQAKGCSSGTCKCARADTAASTGRKTLLIGDGASDFCVASRVDFVFAKNRLIDHCRASGIPHVPISGFEEALACLSLLLDGRLAETSRPLRVSAG